MTHYPKEYLESASEYLYANSLDFTGYKILITGASGFVGSWVIELLRYFTSKSGQEIEVVGLSRDLKSTLQKLGSENFDFVNWIEGGVEKIPEIEFQFTHSVHAATPTTIKTGSMDIANVRHSSIDGMRNLLDLARSNGNKPRILHTSSGAVYGDVKLENGRIPLVQDLRIGTLDHTGRHYEYVLAKREVEELLNSATQNGLVSGINARLFAFYGPGIPTTSHYAIGNLIEQALHARLLQLNGTGKATRSYMTGNSMAAIILYLLSSDIIGATHIGSTEGKTLESWAHLVSDVCGKKVELAGEFDDRTDKYVPLLDKRIPIPNFNKPVRSILIDWMEFINAS
jgi:dTDP-glucose 4,6-dehydratase